MRFLPWLSCLLPLGAIAFLHCGDGELLNAGEECFQAVECAQGLICAPINGRRVCTSDLSAIESPSGYDGSTPPDGGVVQGDAVVYDSPNPQDTAPPEDSFVPPPPDDAGDSG